MAYERNIQKVNVYLRMTDSETGNSKQQSIGNLNKDSYNSDSAIEVCDVLSVLMDTPVAKWDEVKKSYISNSDW